MFDSRRLLAVLLATLLLTGLAGAVAVPSAVADNDQDDPPVPASYHGTLTVDGEPADEGVTIEAVVNDSVEDTITVEDGGSFGGPTAEDEKLTVEGQAGDTVEFFAAGEGLERTQTEETVELEEFDDQELDLTVETDGENGVGNGAPGNGDPAPTPTAIITIEPDTTVDLDEQVTFSSVNSTVEDGTIVDTEWTLEGDDLSTNETVEHTFDDTGDHEVELLVRTDLGEEDTDTVTVTVTDPSDDADDTADDQADDTDDEADDDGIPGFGIVAVLVGGGIAVYRLRH